MMMNRTGLPGLADPSLLLEQAFKLSKADS